eukprot:gene15555-biopygen23199
MAVKVSRWPEMCSRWQKMCPGGRKDVPMAEKDVPRAGKYVPVAEIAFQVAEIAFQVAEIDQNPGEGAWMWCQPCAPVPSFPLGPGTAVYPTHPAAAHFPASSKIVRAWAVPGLCDFGLGWWAVGAPKRPLGMVGMGDGTCAGGTGRWRERGAGCRLRLGMSGAGVARAWRGHSLFPREKRPRPRPVRVRFFKFYHVPRVRSASGPRPLPFLPGDFPAPACRKGFRRPALGGDALWAQSRAKVGERRRRS